MLLTAGLGTRLRPLTNSFAKPAVPFLGVPLLHYAVALMKEAGVNEVTFNTHYLPEQIEKIVSEIRGLQTHISHEPGQPLGSGGGIWKAKDYLKGGDFLVGNGDEVILAHKPEVFARFLQEHQEHESLATILVMKHHGVGTQFGGVWCDADLNVKGFGKDAAKFPGTTGYHYIGLLLLNSKVFEYLPEGESNILYDALAAGIANGDVVRAVVDDFTWFETGNPKDFLHAISDGLQLLETGRKQDAIALREICRSHWGDKVRFRKKNAATILSHESAKIDESSQLDGFVVLEENAVIEAGASVRNCVIMPGARVKSGERRDSEIVIP